MKIAVYSIACDEAHEVAGWEETTREADFRLVLDTGSQDATVMKLTDLRVNVHRGAIRPWRYDDARNAALALIPADIDICIALDMDERIYATGCPSGVGWKAAIEDNWTPNTKMLRCKMISDGKSYYSFRVHTRFGWRWKNPVHETLYFRSTGYVETLTDKMTIEHRPTLTKARPSYTPMLLEGVTEAPTDPRMALIYGWQLCIDGEIEAGLGHLQRYLTLTDGSDTQEIAFVHRLLAKYDPTNFLAHLQRAEQTNQSSSNLIALAEFYEAQKQWASCYTVCAEAIARERKNPTTVGYFGDDVRLSSSWLHDMASKAAWEVWDFEAAYAHAVEGFRRNPDDEHRRTMETIRSAARWRRNPDSIC